ncbi:LysR substrate-binding domain-containing protein [Dyella tabacisoli]|uniref:LysR family transcriptional regulator n=1 Tax=Dyella tabacisoli TaxID=2282381 RepID=A0A369UTD9_9GAMM|nr:LysR substrate-binding domain-containing protein [Dyella tabacisoli]RDD82870.1 LysR family transcriptional regulator [Dyella tabacisoli]
MSVSLVSLASLMDPIRGFVAVGRRMSITLAAGDLCLTQSAVSRQIQTLEERLGIKLLQRGHRSLAFTAEGERLFRSADLAVQQLQDVLGAISDKVGQRPVTLTASIGVTGLWLLPRLGRFQQRHPGVDVRVAANNRLVDLRSEGIDLAIRYCADSAAPEGALRLFGETIAPVAHPSLGLRSLRSAEQLAKHVLLEFDDPQRPWLHWHEWLSQMGWSHIKPKGILRFNQYDQVVQSAMAGQGIALGRLALIGPMLADRRLLTLSPQRAHSITDHGYWLLQADATSRKNVSALVDWLIAESTPA